MKTSLPTAATLRTLCTLWLLISCATLAAEPLRSPRAQLQARSAETVSGLTPDLIDRTIQRSSPRSQAFVASFRRVLGTGPVMDLVHGPALSMSPKDPRYETASRVRRGLVTNF